MVDNDISVTPDGGQVTEPTEKESSGKYTTEELLDQLRACKDKHGKCSTTVFDADTDFASTSTVMRHFVSWVEAKKEAGVYEDLSDKTGRKQTYSTEQILEDLQTCYERNGKVTTKTLRQEEDLVSPTTVVERDAFESWMDAKQKADVPADERTSNSKPQEYTDEDYLDMLRRCQEKHGEVTQRTFNADDEFASAGAVRKRFGSWKEAKDEAGLETETGRYTDEELLEMLKVCANQYGNCSAQKFAADDDFCAPETLQRRFGSWTAAKDEADVN